MIHAILIGQANLFILMVFFTYFSRHLFLYLAWNAYLDDVALHLPFECFVILLSLYLTLNARFARISHDAIDFLHLILYLSRLIARPFLLF